MSVEVAGIAAVLREVHGRDVSAYDEAFLARTVEKRLAEAGVANEAEYGPHLAAHPAEAASGRTEIRVWSAGCASGEEAYSVAILLHERSASAQSPRRFRVFGTDRSKAALTRATAGEFDEEALRESEERFRRIFEESPMAYQSLDHEGRILEVNPAWVSLTGYPRDGEGRILDLKREVNELLAGAGQPPRYPSAVEPAGTDGTLP